MLPSFAARYLLYCSGSAGVCGSRGAVNALRVTSDALCFCMRANVFCDHGPGGESAELHSTRWICGTVRELSRFLCDQKTH